MNTGSQYPHEEPDRSSRASQDSEAPAIDSPGSLQSEVLNLRLPRFMLLVLSGATAVTMTAGSLSMLQSPTLLQQVGCVALSSACSVAIYTIAEKGLRLGPHLVDEGHKAGGVALTLLLALLSATCSSWFTATMFGGQASELAYRDDALTTMDRALDITLESFRTAEREFEPRLMKESLRFKVRSGLEAMGQNTPRPGEGVVFQSEREISESYRTAAGEVTSTLRNARETWASAKEAVRKTRAAIFDPAISRTDADRALQAVAATVSRELAHMQQDSDPLRVPEGFVHVQVQTPERGVTEAERQELSRLADQTDDLSAQLHETAASARAARPDVPRIEFRPKSPGETVLIYASACPGAWVVPLSCDVFAAYICLYTYLGAAELHRRRKAALSARTVRNGTGPFLRRQQMQAE